MQEKALPCGWAAAERRGLRESPAWAPAGNWPRRCRHGADQVADHVMQESIAPDAVQQQVAGWAGPFDEALRGEDVRILDGMRIRGSNRLRRDRRGQVSLAPDW